MSVNIISPINQLGYGIAGLNIVKAISPLARTALFPINIGTIDCPITYKDTIEQCLENAKQPDFNAPCLRIWHQHDMSQFVGKAKHIGFPIFELDKFSNQEIHHLSSLDSIIVCSDWAKKVMQDQVKGVDCSVAPLGVDRDIFKEKISTRKETIFFNCGKWEVRKGHDVLVKAFNSAFNASDDVELWMMCDNPFYSEEQTNYWVNLYKSSKLGDKIRLIPRQKTQKEVYNIMSQSDCGVFPSRAEGWNLEALEMMSCGKDIIITNYSAHTEFCTDKNSRLVEIDELEDAHDGIWFNGQGKWANISDPQMESIIEHMRSIHKTKQDNTKREVNTNGILTAEKFSWANTAQKILNELT